MKILVETPSYAPTVGGLECVLVDLSTEWRRLGNVVCVYRGVSPVDCTCGSTCRAGGMGLARAAREADIVLVANSNLRSFPFLAKELRKTFLQHHSDYSHVKRRATLHAAMTIWIRRRWIRWARNIAVSDWVMHELQGTGEDWQWIENPVSMSTSGFPLAWGKREYDFAFIGRLVEDKGLDILVSALKSLEAPFHAVIGGAGPAVDLLQERPIWNVGGGTIEYAGELGRDDVSKVMSASRWLVVPSRYEPFGLVAVEGLMAGCGLVVSDAGGLKRYIGNCAFGFRSEEVGDLRSALRNALILAHPPAEWEAAAANVVARHKTEDIAERYLALFAADRGVASCVSGGNE